MFLPHSLGMQQQVAAAWRVETRRPRAPRCAPPGRERGEGGCGRVGVCGRLPPTWRIGDLRTRAKEEAPPPSGLPPSFLDILLLS